MLYKPGIDMEKIIQKMEYPNIPSFYYFVKKICIFCVIFCIINIVFTDGILEGNILIEQTKDSDVYYTYLKKDRSFNPCYITTYFGLPGIINKPDQAFCGCRTGSNYDWKKWCENENFELEVYNWQNPIFWKLEKDNKILRIDIQDVIKEDNNFLSKYLANPNDYPEEFRNLLNFSYTAIFDFNKFRRDDIIAVELMNGGIGHMFMNKYERAFYAWDCDSIVVLDETKIIFCEDNK